MNNIVELYEARPERPELGSFAQDRRSFGHHGGRRDTRVNNDAVALVKEAHDDFAQSSARAIGALCARADPLGSFRHGNHRFRVDVRTGSYAVLALYVHETREGFVTYLMGVETNPPRDGRQDWWRRVIRPRLEELLE